MYRRRGRVCCVPELELTGDNGCLP
jgi:hypothetical protein